MPLLLAVQFYVVDAKNSLKSQKTHMGLLVDSKKHPDAKHVPLHEDILLNGALRFWVLPLSEVSGWSRVNRVYLSSRFVNHNETVGSSLLNPAVAEVSPKESKVISGISQGSNLIGMKTNDLSFDHIYSQVNQTEFQTLASFLWLCGFDAVTLVIIRLV